MNLKDKNISEELYTHEFLQDGGEMGRLIRSFDWSKKSIGKPEHWPQSLKTALSIMLRSGYPMFIWWGPELINFNNDAYIPILGEKLFKSIGKTGKELWQEIWDTLEPMVETIFQGKQVYRRDLLLMINRNNISEETYFSFSYSPIIDESGKIGGLFCACHEETERVIQQRRTEISSELNSALAKLNQRDEVGTKTIEILKKSNRDISFAAYYDYLDQKTKLIDYSWISQSNDLKDTIYLNNEDEADQFCIKKAIKTKQPSLVENITLELSNPTHKKYESYCAYTIPIQKNENEKKYGVLVLGISPNLIFDEKYKKFLQQIVYEVASAIERIQIKAEIQREKERLEAFFMQAPAAICILGGPDMVYELVNPGYQKLFPGRNILGKPLREALPEFTSTPTYKILQDVYQTGKPVEVKEMLIPVARSEDQPIEDIYFNYIVQPKFDKNGTIDGLMVFAFEVTEQKKAEAALHASQLELDMANRAIQAHNKDLSKNNKELVRINNDLDNFIYTASHDLKAPVSNLEGLIKVLATETGISEEQEPIVDLMSQSIERFKNTIKDLTEISKIQKGVEDDENIVSFEEMLEEVRKTLANAISEQNAHIEEDFQEKEIKFSRKNLRSILYNLISNAIKYSSPDRKPKIKVATIQEEHYVILKVADNGLGMTQDDIGKLFQMFKRMHQHVDGTGIGLYMIRRMVENVGGKIEVESELGKGSVFTVYLTNTNRSV